MKRNKAWRRFQAYKYRHSHSHETDCFKPEKNWKQLYFRSNKIARAKQLGMTYPRKTRQQITMNASEDLNE